IQRAGGQVMGEKLYFGSYYDLPAITQIITKAQRMLSFKPVDFDVGLKATYRAYLKKRGYPKPDYTFEDELLSRFSQLTHTMRSA
ncbi:MAG TPA: NAD-dependent dehydratase, partial [Bryobacteraceae bacterium]